MFSLPRLHTLGNNVRFYGVLAKIGSGHTGQHNSDLDVVSLQFGPRRVSELAAEQAEPCAKGHIAAFAFPTRDALFEAVGDVYRKSISLPTLPLEMFERETAHLGKTEAERIEKVRLGQDIFRNALLAYWKDTCPITGITDGALLRASHIIPWARYESDAERLNVHNGLLLSSLWDAAFDAGLITFDDDGRPIASAQLTAEAMATLQIANAAPLPLTSEHRVRLAWHRVNLWQR